MKLYTTTKLLLLFLLINACASNNVDQSEEEPKPISVATDFDNKLVFEVSSSIDIPVIASGGVGNLQHLIDGIREGGAEAVLAASIFHFEEYTIKNIKQYLNSKGIKIRND